MFCKKFLTFFVALALTLCAVLMSTQMLFAKANTADAHDEYFLEFVKEDTGVEDVEYTKIQLYDANLNPNGRQYVFSVNGVNGYALTKVVQIGEQFFYEIEELFYSVPAPFVNYQGLPVYVTFNTYLDSVNGTFYDLTNNRAVVSQETVVELASKGFGYMGNGSGDYTVTTETINYATKSTQSYSFPYNAPNIYGSLDGISNCANNAGATVITYYDRFYENLIPNFQAYTVFLGRIVYRDGAVEVSDVIRTLVSYMAVDGVSQGTTFTGFQQGMERYVEEHGYTYSTTSLMSWGDLDLDDYIDYVENEIPVALFLNGFTMCGVSEGTNQDTVSNSTYVATHVEVGIGYKIHTYYNASGSVITSREYLKVASGIFDYGIGYLNISSNAGGDIVNAIAIEIS